MFFRTLQYCPYGKKNCYLKKTCEPGNSASNFANDACKCKLSIKGIFGQKTKKQYIMLLKFWVTSQTCFTKKQVMFDFIHDLAQNQHTPISNYMIGNLFS